MAEAAKKLTTHYEVIADAANPEEWHESRAGLVTASKVPTILGENPYRSALEQWLIETGQQLDEDSESEAAEWGLRLEPVIRAAYEDRTNRKTSPGGLLLRSMQYPWLGATLDAWVTIDGTEVPLEIKTVGAGRQSDWDEGVPDYYKPQVYTQMIVTGADRASVACLIGGQRLVIHDLDRDPDECERIIRETQEFRRRVDDWEPPPPDGSDSAERALLRLYPEEESGKTVMLDEDAVQLTERLDEIQGQLNALEKEKKGIRQQLESRIGDAERGLLPGGEKCWAWRTQSRKEYTVPAKEFRVLRKVKAS